MPLVGRQPETAYFADMLASADAEFIAVYGRRRVGKTFLIREHLKPHLAFELTGIQDASLPEQLANFQESMKLAKAPKTAPPKSWQEAFQKLATHLEKLPKNRKHVIFLDELPWLAGRRAKFLPALDHFWNTWLSRRPQFLLIVCGSAASWMISNLINHKGGLHNRITGRMRLEPFTLAESEAYLKSRNIRMTRYDLLSLSMACGGIPHYLRAAQRGQSAIQVMDKICFSKTGMLVDEFPRLYQSLFEHPNRHLDLVRTLAKHPQGLDRNKLTEAYASGGRLTQTLDELTQAGFITPTLPFGKKSKDTLYRLTDEYSVFYLRWIEKHKGDAEGAFLRKQASPSWRAWSGYALESIAHRHLPQIKTSLGISGIETTHASWLHRPNDTWPQGAQIDLLLDRADNTINLFEIKFSQGPFTITKAYANDLRRKLETFRAVSRTRKNVFLTFLTTHGLTENAYAAELAHQSLTTDCLFAP